MMFAAALRNATALRLKGVRYAAEFSGRARSLGIQMSVEATALGLFMAVWWRMSHAQEKALYDKYYATLRASKESAE